MGMVDWKLWLNQYLFNRKRSKTAKAILKISKCERNNVKCLLRFLNKNNYEIQCSAMKALRGVGFTKGAVGPLFRYFQNLNNFDTRRRGEAVSMLGRMGGAEAVEPLIKIMQSLENDEFIRSEAISALGSIGDLKAVEPLMAILQNPENDYYLRKNAISALASIGNPVALESLIRSLSDGRTLISGKKALEEIKKKTPEKFTEDIQKAIQRESLAGVRALIDDVMNPQAETHLRRQAAEDLGSIGDSVAVEPLIKIVQNPENDYYLRKNAISALASIADPVALEALVRSLRDYKMNKVVKIALETVRDVNDRQHGAIP
jgi:HEAT repeat protein